MELKAYGFFSIKLLCYWLFTAAHLLYVALTYLTCWHLSTGFYMRSRKFFLWSGFFSVIFFSLVGLFQSFSSLKGVMTPPIFANIESCWGLMVYFLLCVFFFFSFFSGLKILVCFLADHPHQEYETWGVAIISQRWVLSRSLGFFSLIQFFFPLL